MKVAAVVNGLKSGKTYQLLGLAGVKEQVSKLSPAFFEWSKFADVYTPFQAAWYKSFQASVETCTTLTFQKFNEEYARSYTSMEFPW